jgi:hypothetical protein
MSNPKEETLDRKEKILNEYMADLQALKEIEVKLTEHKNKLIDARFFMANFAETIHWGDGIPDRTYAKYRLTDPRYMSDRYQKTLYVSEHCRVELQTRETAHVLAQVQKEIDKYEAWANDCAGTIANILDTDYAALVADLKAVYRKHGSPHIWNETLKAYEVTDPKDENL